MEKKNDAITSRDVDFAKWYTDVCRKADLMEYYSVKGFIEYLPYSYAMWEEIQNYLNGRFKENGAENVYLPMVIPASVFNKEKEHVEGFAPECLVATIGGGNQLTDPLIIRPTSETIFSELFKKRINSVISLSVITNGALWFVGKRQPVLSFAERNSFGKKDIVFLKRKKKLKRTPSTCFTSIMILEKTSLLSHF